MQASIGMPRACISCRNYQPKGYAEDEHCPFQAEYSWREKPTRTPFGVCEHDDTRVFATEICDNYLVEPGVDPIPVPNRPRPMEAHQGKLILEDCDAAAL